MEKAAFSSTYQNSRNNYLGYSSASFCVYNLVLKAKLLEKQNRPCLNSVIQGVKNERWFEYFAHIFRLHVLNSNHKVAL